MQLIEKYIETRARTKHICAPLQTEDYVVQPVVDVSPPKWHIGHTTWFFETFVLKPHAGSYQEFNSDFSFIFNSYYESVGTRVLRTNRGNLTRPTVEEVYHYHAHVDAAMLHLLSKGVPKDLHNIIEIGINHEQQHQELLYTDIKFILGHNPLFPTYGGDPFPMTLPVISDNEWIIMPEGIYEIGSLAEGFCFDNELGRHKVYLQEYRIAKKSVTNGEYLAFIEAGGYEQFKYWHAEGWDWVNQNKITAPLYWYKIDGVWHNYTFEGLKPVDWNETLCHISYYEAAAYAHWKGMRLPTEFEWEAASTHTHWGERWEWTNSAYLPYPGFTVAEGAIGEYNGKFMINQMVLRGASVATPPGHSRNTYRNFFQPHLRWQFNGIRLAQ
jgi:ergothioneine biosynthesis protein EgtB